MHRDCFIRAVIRHVRSVETCDDPTDFHMGPDFDEYQVTVEQGPEGRFLEWFQQVNPYDWCRVGGTSNFIDMGSSHPRPDDGHVIEMTFDEYFDQWLDSRVKSELAKIELQAWMITSGL